MAKKSILIKRFFVRIEGKKYGKDSIVTVDSTLAEQLINACEAIAVSSAIAKTVAKETPAAPTNDADKDQGNDETSKLPDIDPAANVK